MQLSIISTIVAVTLTASSTSAANTNSIAFAGGGFRAHAVASGVMAGMLGAAQENQIGSEKPTFDTLMRSFRNIASNSGGTWFATQFIYSEKFQKLLETLASASEQHSNPKEIGGHYHDEFIARLLFSTQMTEAMLQMPEPNLTQSQLDLDLEGSIEDALLQLLELAKDLRQWQALISNYFRPSDVSWRSFVDTILRIPGDFDPSLPLSKAKINSWANKKRYAVAGSLVQPSDRKSVMTAAAFEKPCMDRNGKLSLNSISMVNRYPSPGLATPITFSTDLNFDENPNMESPYEFMHSPRVAEVRDQTYFIMSESSFYNWGSVQSATEAYHETYEQLGPGLQSHRMPIVDVASTSSSFLSQVVTLYDGLGAIGLLVKKLGLWPLLTGFVMPMALDPSVPAEDMFQLASKLRHADVDGGISCDAWMRKSASSMVTPVADGGYIDNSAVSNILSDAQDGDEYLLILNSNKPINDDILNLFVGENVNGDYFTPIPISLQSQGYAREEVAKFKSMVLNSTNVLRGLDYGTIHVELFKNLYFGIETKSNVKFNVIAVNADMGLAPLSWDSPSMLVGEIVATLRSPQNREAAKDILKTFFQYCECDCSNNDVSSPPVQASMLTLQRHANGNLKNSEIDAIELSAGSTCNMKWTENFDSGKEYSLQPKDLDACFRGKTISMRIKYKNTCHENGGTVPSRFTFDIAYPNELRIDLNGADVWDNLNPGVSVIHRCNAEPQDDSLPIYDVGNFMVKRDIASVRDTQLDHIEFIKSPQCSFIWKLKDISAGETDTISIGSIMTATGCIYTYDVISMRFGYKDICPKTSFWVQTKSRIGYKISDTLVLHFPGIKPETSLDHYITLEN